MLGNQSAFQQHLAQRAVFDQRLLSDPAGVSVADMRGKGRDRGNRAFKKNRQFSLFALMPSIAFRRSVWQALAIISIDSNRFLNSTGSKTFSSSCPASAALAIVTSLPMTLKQAWLQTSAMTGLTLPGMIELPGCRSGSLISAKPAFGPEAIIRKSLHILDRLTASTFSAPEANASVSQLRVPSTRFLGGAERDAADF